MDFSPRHAETLQLSPSHIHTLSTFHDDLQNLRRSISRSPSKVVRLHRSSLESPTSPSKHSPLAQQFHAPKPFSPIARASRDANAPSAPRRVRPSLARATPIKANVFASPRTEVQPQQLARRPLSVASDFGNSSSQSSQDHAGGQENQATTPDGSPPDSQIFSVSRPKPQNTPFRVPAARPKSIAATELNMLKGSVPAKSSPLKRSDGVMNLDQPSFGSPSAKRRSLHGALFEVARDEEFKSQIMAESDGESDADEASFRSTMSSRLNGAPRKSHIPLRFGERAHISRNRRSLELDLGTPAPRRAYSKSSSRGFSDAGCTFAIENNGVETPTPIEPRPHFPRPARLQPHPLSRTINPASPLQSGIAHTTKTNSNVPSTPDERPAFSKSLPIGALRPQLGDCLARSSGKSSANAEFSTPRAFEDVRPDPIAFQSTGLISKRHRDPDDMPPPPGQPGAMPDTPCKKGSVGLGDQNSPTSITSIAKPRFGQPLFGTPAKPLDANSIGRTPSFGIRSVGLTNDYEPTRLNRSTSFVSNDGSDYGQSPQGSQAQAESHSSADELPPTPTKQIVGPSGARTNSKDNSLRSSIFGRRTSIGPGTFSPPGSDEQASQGQRSTHRACKSISLPTKTVDADLRTFALRSLYRIPIRSKSLDILLPSFATALQHQSQSPVNGLPHLASTTVLANASDNQISNLANVNNLYLVTQSLCMPPSGTPIPRTPADIGFPDPSQLSISPSGKAIRTPSWRSSLRSTFSKPPETPSTHRENAQNSSLAGILTTPSHHATAGRDVDAVLSQRFRKVIWLGQGQFSDVYKVYQAQHRSNCGMFFSPGDAPGGAIKDSSAPAPDAVYVVKKTKAPLHGSRVRERTIREVHIMQALRRNDHVVTLVDSWEAGHHLYLMTEFCEEGALDKFLEREGRSGRLDDFRIWKIMLEVASGLQHIHSSGFMHLDLKPENIFIDFAGTLKVGDFGLACEWPAPKSVEGEGDRRYIGPDLLLGNFDKPADVFAFGMMMYEIAGNFVPPDNGASWQKLRSGDFSGLPSLTSGSSNSLPAVNSSSFMCSEIQGYDNPPLSPNTVYSSRPEFGKLDTCDDTHMASTESLTTPRAEAGQPSMLPATELAEPPAFMFDPDHPDSLDRLVHWMMLPLPEDRPDVEQVLQAGGCRWVGERRRAGAVVWEGKWGPSDAVLMRASNTTTVQDEPRMLGIKQESQAPQGTFFDDADAEMIDA